MRFLDIRLRRSFGVSCALVASLSVMSCGQSPSSPTNTTTGGSSGASCQSANTANLSLENLSGANSYSVLIDGTNEGTIAPSQTLGPIAVTAGVNHTIVAQIVSSGAVACSSTLSFTQCSTQTLTCSN